MQGTAQQAGPWSSSAVRQRGARWRSRSRKWRLTSTLFRQEAAPRTRAPTRRRDRGSAARRTCDVQRRMECGRHTTSGGWEEGAPIHPCATHPPPRRAEPPTEGRRFCSTAGRRFCSTAGRRRFCSLQRGARHRRDAQLGRLGAREQHRLRRAAAAHRRTAVAAAAHGLRRAAAAVTTAWERLLSEQRGLGERRARVDGVGAEVARAQQRALLHLRACGSSGRAWVSSA